MSLSYYEALAQLELLRVYSGLNRPTQLPRLLDALGRPQTSLRCIHIAGTNGKGSVAAMIESIYRHSGYRVGLFTSPHLQEWTERIQVDRSCISCSDFAQICTRVFEAAHRVQSKHAGMCFTPFELLTACACCYFAQHKVDIVILEVGIGGRLDPTNAVGKLLSVITSISFDHEAWLGTTLASIAAEKAGIIASKTPVVLGVLLAEAESVIRAYAWAHGASVIAVEEVFGVDTHRFPRVSLEGEHQRMNAATATLAVRELQETFPVLNETIERGLRTTYWAGRWERVQLAESKTLILEAAHNAAGAVCLEQMIISEIKRQGSRPHICVGFLGEARAKAVLAVVVKYAQSISCIDMNADPQAVNLECCEAMIRDLNYLGPVRTVSAGTIFEKSKACKLGDFGEWILATGSIRLLGQILKLIEP